MRLVKALDRDRRVTAVPYQKPGVAVSAGLTVQECAKAAWVITPDGKRYRGAEAINVVLTAALGVRLPHLVYRLPPIGQLEDYVYGWVADNRGKLPGDAPYCSQHPDECRSGEGSAGED